MNRNETWCMDTDCTKLHFVADSPCILKGEGLDELREKLTTRGIGGAPSRATTLPEDSKERKGYPIASGFLDYFPDAIVAVARLSYLANEQHNAGEPMHWARSKSTDEENTMMRHFLQRGSLDTDGQRHTAKMVWRSLAILQKEIEGEK